jgi:hypothetical protein
MARNAHRRGNEGTWPEKGTEVERKHFSLRPTPKLDRQFSHARKPQVNDAPLQLARFDPVLAGPLHGDRCVPGTRPTQAAWVQKSKATPFAKERDDKSDVATQTFLFDQTCWRPQRGQRLGKLMSGRLSNITELVVRPVGMGRLVTGHIVMISLMLSSPNCWDNQLSNKSGEHLFQQKIRSNRRKIALTTTKTATFALPAHGPRPPRPSAGEKITPASFVRRLTRADHLSGHRRLVWSVFELVY